jgi:site-specific DNA recombinase
MIAAIYARKSTEQNGVADEQKSIARQIEHARAYATHKGWTVRDDCIYVDDGISGAEFTKRPGFLRLMNALKPQPVFQALIMSEESRLGREAIETTYALKQLVTAGVRVFFYLEDRERTLDSPTDKIMLSLTAFADELEREKARQRTTDAMQRKARAGHVTGGRVFGYDNAEVLDADGRRSHVMRRVNETEAAVVRSIFKLCAEDIGVKGIAVHLNDEGAASPRAQQRRPNGWSPSSVREALDRDLSRGLVIYNKTRKRDQWGRKHQTERPDSEWSVLTRRIYKSSPRRNGLPLTTGSRPLARPTCVALAANCGDGRSPERQQSTSWSAWRGADTVAAVFSSNLESMAANARFGTRVRPITYEGAACARTSSSYPSSPPTR